MNEDDIIIHPTVTSEHTIGITVTNFNSDKGWKNLSFSLNNKTINIDDSDISYMKYTIHTLDKLTKQEYSTQKIPKVIIQTNEIEQCDNVFNENSVQLLKDMNEEYDYRFFNSIERRSFIKEHFEDDVLKAYDTIISNAFKADIFRYCYLYKFGGVYIDHKIIPRKPLRYMIKPTDTLLIVSDFDKKNTIDRTTSDSYLNAIIMTAPKDIRFLELINECVNNILYKQGHWLDSIDTFGYRDVLSVTGPKAFYKIFKDKVELDCIRFKHIIENNDETFYKNFQIIDIDTKELLFTKTYKNNKQNVHYSDQWIKKDVFYKNYQKFLNMIVLTDPYPFNDSFKYLINNDNITVERTDSTDCWGLNLNIKVIDDNTSQHEYIHFGRERVRKLQTIKPLLPSNCCFINNIDVDVDDNVDSNVAIIPAYLHHQILNIRELHNECYVIVYALYDITQKDLLKLSTLADKVVLFNGVENYHYIEERSFNHIYPLYKILNHIQNTKFKSFTPLFIDNDIRCISKDKINKYLIKLNNSIMTDEVEFDFIKFSKNFIDVNIEEEFNQKIEKYSEVLNDLNNAVIECNEKLEGNVFYENDSYGVFNVLEIFKNKRFNLYQLAKTSTNILEVGFNAGHSTLIYLIANDTSTIQLFDLNDHKYTEKCFEILNNHFPGRLSIVYGDSTKTIKTFKNGLFDMIHIDGGHTRTIAEQDFFNCKRLSSSSGVVIVDDANAEPTKSLVETWLIYGHVHMVKQPYNTDYHFIGKY